MLHEFIAVYRQEIVARTADRVRSRPWPSVANGEVEYGVPLFLTQLSETLRLEHTSTPYASDAIGVDAARHGAELLAAGFTITQVVHDYGDICQAITELAAELHTPITVAEFHTLNRCLDTAIAEAVTEHARLTAERRSAEEVERLGYAAHELRDLLNSALLAFHTLKRGTVAVNGSTGAVLGRSLTSLRELVDRSLSDVRLTAGIQRRERIPVTTLADELTAGAILHSEYRHVRFSVAAVDSSACVDADLQLLTSAAMNLLQNAFTHTPEGGVVTLRFVPGRDSRLRIEVEDQCGGIPEGRGDLFQPFTGHADGSGAGLGLGLSIARRAVRAHDGDIEVRNMPGRGCIFTMDLPLAPEHVPLADPH